MKILILTTLFLTSLFGQTRIPTLDGNNVFTGTQKIGTTVTALGGPYAAPDAPVLTGHGSAGGSPVTYGYKARCRTMGGQVTTESTEATISWNSTLDSTNYVAVAVGACPIANSVMDIYLSTAGGNVPTAGYLVAAMPSSTYNHEGLDGVSGYPVSATTNTVDNSMAATNNMSIGGAGSADGSPSANYIPQMSLGGGALAGVLRAWGGGGNGAFWDTFSSEGTVASPVASAANDYLFAFNNYGYNGRYYQYGTQLLGYVGGNPNSDGSLPGYISLQASNSGALDTIWYFYRDGTLILPNNTGVAPDGTGGIKLISSAFSSPVPAPLSVGSVKATLLPTDCTGKPAGTIYDTGTAAAAGGGTLLGVCH